MATLSVEKLSHDEVLAALQTELQKHVAELYPPVMVQWKSQKGKTGQALVSCFEPPKTECLRRMFDYMGERAFREGAAEIYFGHGPWFGAAIEPWAGQIIMSAAKPSVELVAQIDARLEFLCRNAYTEIRLPRYSASFHEESGRFSGNTVGYGEPNRSVCTALLLAAADRPDAVAVLKKIADGSFNYGPFDVLLPVYSAGQLTEERAIPLRSYERFQQDMFPLQLTEVLLALADAGALTQELFAAAARNLPETLNWLAPEELQARDRRSDNTKQLVAEMANQFAKDVSVNFDADWHLLPLMYGYRNGCWLRGSWALLEAARHHERLKLGKLQLSSWSYYYDWFHAKKRIPELAVAHLANAQQTEPEAAVERKQLIEQLRKFPRKTLQALLPVAMRSARILCEALGCDSAFPLIERVYAQANLPAHPGYVRDGRTAQDATGNSADPANGVLDLAAAQKLIAAAGEQTAQKVLTGLVESNGAVDNTAMLFAAVGGFNLADITKKIAKRNQTAVKAWGLLPLKRGKKEALERYVQIRKFAEESDEFGPERRANERAAAQSALANLAQVAGYANALRLEWAMEAQQGAQEDPFARTWRVGGARAQMVLEGSEPKLQFYTKDKLLKTAPAALKDSDKYEEMKELLASTKLQYKRLKSSFEQMMVHGETLNGTDIQALSLLPIANRLLSRLVFERGDDATKFFGTWTKGALTGLAGKKRTLDANTVVVIAHAYHLFAEQQLAAWQREFVRREWLQPFRQVFREVYLPLDSEREKEECERFVGQHIKTAVATKLFTSRGWEFRNAGHVQLFYFDRKKQLVAEWLFPEANHYLAEQPTTPLGVIRFARGVPQGDRTRIDQKLKLGEVPPVFLSEVLRDADLVCSVAGTEVKPQASPEVQQRRAEAVRAVLAPLAMEGVSFAGEFVRVIGKLAEYRVSCQNASIVREPGQQTFVFPAGTRLQDEKLFLPFADDEDELLSAVCTAVLLLTHDDQIKDKTLLRALGVLQE